MSYGNRVDPKLLEFATAREREYIEAINTHGGYAGAARALGTSKGAPQQAIQWLIRRAERRGYSPDHDMTKTVPEGYRIKGVSTYYNKEGKAAGQWVKSTADDERKRELLLAEIEGWKTDIVPIVPMTQSKPVNDDLITIYPFGDPHAGLYSWRDETGEGFDLAEFKRVNMLAIDQIVAASPPSAIALYNDKGDTTHANDSKNRTPGSGNPLDVHGRHIEVMRAATAIKRYHITRLLEKHGKVIVRIDPGNHDPETALAISMIIEALYENEPRVEVVSSPNPYWYYQFGANLIGTCHGDGAKGADLPLLMATDAREWWGAAKYCVWFVGHVHHKDIKDYNGCVVEYVRNLAPNDAWHHSKGYRSPRTLEAITLHRDGGEECRQTFNLNRVNTR